MSDHADLSALEKQYDIPDGLYVRLINDGERSGPTAVSSMGAIGRAQLRPGTARDMGLSGSDIWDDKRNVEGGAKYLKWLHDQLGDWSLAVAAYNDGIGNVRKAGGVPAKAMDYVGRVMGTGGSATTTTDPAAAMAEDPARKQMMADLGVATKQATEANNELRTDLGRSNEAYGQQIKGLREEVGDLPLPPTLRDLPTPPDPKDTLKDPQRALGQFLPALAVLGSLGTRRAATTAFKSAAAAMKAQKENDKELFQDKHQEWKDNMESALDSWNAERDRYLDIINNKKMSMEERLSELRVQAAVDDNKRLMAAATVGNVDMIYKNLQAGDMAAYHLATVMNQTNRNETARAAAEEKERADKAHEDIQRMEAGYKAASANKLTLSQWVAQQMALKGGAGANWTDAQEQLLARAESDLQRLNLGGDTPPPAAPGGKPAAPAAAPPVAGGPGSKASPLPLPPNPKPSDLKKGAYYKTARGEAMWDGHQFVVQ